MEPTAVKTEMDDSATNAKKGAVQCPKCDKIVTSSSNLKNHMKWIHDLVRDRHMCDMCCKTFSISKDLKNHQMVHTGEKNFPCHICGKRYQTKYYLICHTRIHTGEKPFSCEECGKSFSDRSSFNDHSKRHRSKGFPYRASLTKHLVKNHSSNENLSSVESNMTSENQKVENQSFKLKSIYDPGNLKTVQILNWVPGLLQ